MWIEQATAELAAKNRAWCCVALVGKCVVAENLPLCGSTTHGARSAFVEVCKFIGFLDQQVRDAFDQVQDLSLVHSNNAHTQRYTGGTAGVKPCP